MARRAGITAIECLVIILILAALLALFAMSIQRLQDSRKRTECSNNLKKIGLATHAYAGQNKYLPPGADWKGAGVLVHLLPFLDAKDYANDFSLKAPAVYYMDPKNRPATTDTAVVPRPPQRYGAEGELSMFICPAAPAPRTTKTALLMVNYGDPGKDYPEKAPSGHVFSSCPGCVTMGRSNYLGIAVGNGDYRRGVFQFFPIEPSPKWPSFSRFPCVFVDGTSNTLMFAEYAGGFLTWGDRGGIEDGMVTASWACGFNYADFGGPAPRGSQTTEGEDGATNSAFALFSSDHSGHVIMVCYGDASARSISPAISFAIWMALADPQDGLTPQVD